MTATDKPREDSLTSVLCRKTICWDECPTAITTKKLGGVWGVPSNHKNISDGKKKS